MKLSEIAKRNFSSISKEYFSFIKEKSKCKKCDIFNYYKTVIQSEGNAKNPIFMVLAEAPGKIEVEQGKPLIGLAGQELRSVLREYGFNKKNTILTNVIPCRPLDNKFPQEWNIVNECLEKWLIKEIELLKPKFIITCGIPALRAITSNNRMGVNRGVWKYSYIFNCWTLATWHPSYVLRCKNDPAKQNVSTEFRSDIKKVSQEWHAQYADKRLHMDKKQQSNNAFNELIKNHILMMDEQPQSNDMFSDSIY